MKNSIYMIYSRRSRRDIPGAIFSFGVKCLFFIGISGIITTSWNGVNGETVARMYLEVDNYYNPLGRLANGRSCDPSTRCDSFFIICVSSSQNPDGCSYVNATTEVFGETNSVSGTIKDIRKEITSLNSSSFFISIMVMEYDFSNQHEHELIAIFLYNGTVAALSDRLLPQKRTVLSMTRQDKSSYNKDVKLNVGFDILCGPNHFGDFCQIVCIPQAKYDCESNGAKLCREGFVGKDCELDDLCINNTVCVQDAKCIMQNHGELICECPKRDHSCYRNAPYTSCYNNPCQNGGECTAEKYHFNCKCKEPFKGPHCESLTDFCKLKPCLNGGKCIDEINGYQCVCNKQYKGRNCEVLSKTQCDSNPCQNGGHCIEIENVNATPSFQCKCNDSFTGELCSTPTTAASSLQLMLVVNVDTITIGAVSLGVILLLIVSTLVICCIRQRRRSPETPKSKNSPEMIDIREMSIHESDYLTPVLAGSTGGRLSVSTTNESGHYEIPELENGSPYEFLCYEDPDKFSTTQNSSHESGLKGLKPSLPPRIFSSSIKI